MTLRKRQDTRVSDVEIIEPINAGVGTLAPPDWGFEPDADVDEQYRRDIEEIDQAEKAADRDSTTLRVY